MSFNGGGEHPALTASRARLEALERRTPPGYPLGYSLHILSWACTGCGAQGAQETLWTVVRAGAAGRAYHPTSPNEKLYELPVEFVKKSSVTPRCQACIGLLAREAVPALPPYNARLKTDRNKEEEIDIDDLFKAEEIDLAALGLLD